jgi:hypothetical protein
MLFHDLQNAAIVDVFIVRRRQQSRAYLRQLPDESKIA